MPEGRTGDELEPLRVRAFHTERDPKTTLEPVSSKAPEGGDTSFCCVVLKYKWGKEFHLVGE